MQIIYFISLESIDHLTQNLRIFFNRDFLEKNKTHIKYKKCLILVDFSNNLMNLDSVVSCQNFYCFFFISENPISSNDIRVRVTLSNLLSPYTSKFYKKKFFTDVLQTNISNQYANFCCVPNWLTRFSNVSKCLFMNY